MGACGNADSQVPQTYWIKFQQDARVMPMNIPTLLSTDLQIPPKWFFKQNIFSNKWLIILQSNM